jgi:hypothetical protein
VKVQCTFCPERSVCFPILQHILEGQLSSLSRNLVSLRFSKDFVDKAYHRHSCTPNPIWISWSRTSPPSCKKTETSRSMAQLRSNPKQSKCYTPFQSADLDIPRNQDRARYQRCDEQLCWSLSVTPRLSSNLLLSLWDTFSHVPLHDFESSND